jgi:hypothetical protein
MTDRKKEIEDGKVTTTSGRIPEIPVPGAPEPIDPKTGQHTSYWILSESERAKGFVRPVRRSYVHVGPKDDPTKGCRTVTTMSQAIAETYARDPNFYGATFCVDCGVHLRVGEAGEFIWDGTNERVGT